ncbi:Uncharacterized protein NEOC95_001988 [Neochlamydia sp. AcF95]|nr:Uncharacterized protein [Neochlamydia sp. AcF95]
MPHSDYNHRRSAKLRIIKELDFTLGPLHESIQELILNLNPNLKHVLLVIRPFGRN